LWGTIVSALDNVDPEIATDTTSTNEAGRVILVSAATRVA
jgi:hypothetical protein